MDRRGFLGSMAAVAATTGVGFRFLPALEARELAPDEACSDIGDWLMAEVTYPQGAAHDATFALLLTAPSRRLTEAKAVAIKRDGDRSIIAFCLPSGVKGVPGQWMVQTRMSRDGEEFLSPASYFTVHENDKLKSHWPGIEWPNT